MKNGVHVQMPIINCITTHIDKKIHFHTRKKPPKLPKNNSPFNKNDIEQKIVHSTNCNNTCTCNCIDIVRQSKYEKSVTIFD